MLNKWGDKIKLFKTNVGYLSFKVMFILSFHHIKLIIV